MDEHFRYELAQTCDTLGLRLDESGRQSEALAAFDRARELGEALFRATLTDAQIAHELVRTLGNMALALDAPVVGTRRSRRIAGRGRCS